MVMNILCTLTLRSLRKNTKRTTVTIVGIILATALITAVANLAESFRASMIAYEKMQNGDFHYCFAGVEPEDLKYFENNAYIERMAVSREVGYALLEDSVNPDKPYIYIRAMDEQSREMSALKLKSGRWPENENEIVIASHVRSNGGSRLTTGDVITLTMGVRDIGEGYVARQNNPYSEEEKFAPSGQREYTVVGVMDRPNYLVEARTAPGYTAVTCPGESETEWMVVYAAYTRKGLRNRDEVTAGLESLARGGVSRNADVLRWEMMHFSGRLMNIVYGMGLIALAIIIVTAVFCIRNSFQISLTEKMRLYGMLASVGTTAKQRRKLVYYEAFFLGCIGIPLGVGSGVLATFVLTRVCSELVRYAVDMKLIYIFSLPAAIVGAALAAVTVFLSAFKSARRAAKITPINAIRSNETIRRGRRELRTPKYVKSLFGIGGTLAYKNLRRSRVKYRTTVLSIVVSVAVFIAMTSFINLGFRLTKGQLYAGEYPIMVTLTDEDREEEAALISSFEEVQGTLVRRSAVASIPKEQFRCTERWGEMEELGWSLGVSEYERNVYGVRVFSIGESAYEEYCREVGVSPEEAGEGAIVYAEFRCGVDDGQGMRYYEGTIADFEQGSTLDLRFEYTEDSEDKAEIFPVTVVRQTKVMPGFMTESDNTVIMCIVSDRWMSEHLEDYIYPQLALYLKCEDADALENRIRCDVPMYSYYVSNYERAQREERNFWLLLAIFLYGFITVISLIGITNIFNTITTNMELRSREFAMLKSVGMTGREFGRMVQLESVFYGGRALCIGIPLGCVLSRLFYMVFGSDLDMPFEFPVSGILISVAAVALLLFVIMRYSMGKINRKNIIETIQNENI